MSQNCAKVFRRCAPRMSQNSKVWHCDIWKMLSNSTLCKCLVQNYVYPLRLDFARNGSDSRLYLPCFCHINDKTDAEGKENLCGDLWISIGITEVIILMPSHAHLWHDSFMILDIWDASRPTYERVMPHICINHVTRMQGSCHACEWVMTQCRRLQSQCRRLPSQVQWQTSTRNKQSLPLHVNKSQALPKDKWWGLWTKEYLALHKKIFLLSSLHSKTKAHQFALQSQGRMRGSQFVQCVPLARWERERDLCRALVCTFSLSLVCSLIYLLSFSLAPSLFPFVVLPLSLSLSLAFSHSLSLSLTLSCSLSLSHSSSLSLHHYFALPLSHTHTQSRWPFSFSLTRTRSLFHIHSHTHDGTFSLSLSLSLTVLSLWWNVSLLVLSVSFSAALALCFPLSLSLSLSFFSPLSFSRCFSPFRILSLRRCLDLQRSSSPKHHQNTINTHTHTHTHTDCPRPRVGQETRKRSFSRYAADTQQQ